MATITFLSEYQGSQVKKKEWITPVLSEENIDEETMLGTCPGALDGTVHTYATCP